MSLCLILIKLTHKAMSTLFVLFVVCGYLALFLFIEGAFVLWNDTRGPEAQRLQQRLKLMSAEERTLTLTGLSKRRVLSEIAWLQRLLQDVPLIEDIDRLLVQSGSSMDMTRLLLQMLVCGVLAAMLATSWGPALMLAVFIVGALLPLARLRWMRERRMQKIVEQLPDALDLVCRSLRAGHAFSTCLSMVGAESPEPIAGEFKTTFDEISFGLSTKNALLNLVQRVPVTDIRYLVVAVVIQLETGGNLTELLGLLASLIRERFKLYGKVRVLAAEGKLSAYIMLALPFVVAGALQFVNPNYMRVLIESEEGLRVVWMSLLMMALGTLWMWRIVKIKV